MKATVRDGKLYDNQTGLQIQFNRTYLYPVSKFSSYPDNTMVDIKNCWRYEDIISEDVRICYGEYLEFDITEPQVISSEQSVIDETNNVETNESDGDSDESSRNSNDSINSGISDSSMYSSVQDESANVESVSASDSE